MLSFFLTGHHSENFSLARQHELLLEKQVCFNPPYIHTSVIRPHCYLTFKVLQERIVVTYLAGRMSNIFPLYFQTLRSRRGEDKMTEMVQVSTRRTVSFVYVLCIVQLQYVQILTCFFLSVVTSSLKFLIVVLAVVESSDTRGQCRSAKLHTWGEEQRKVYTGTYCSPRWISIFYKAFLRCFNVI